MNEGKEQEIFLGKLKGTFLIFKRGKFSVCIVQYSE